MAIVGYSSYLEYQTLSQHLQLVIEFSDFAEMSLPDEKVAGYAVPNLVYSLLIDKYLDEPSCTSLAISEVLDGFSPLYSMSRLYLIHSVYYQFKFSHIFSSCITGRARVLLSTTSAPTLHPHSGTDSLLITSHSSPSKC